MKNFFLLLLSIIFLSFSSAKAALCKKDFLVSITMDDDWYLKEELRLAREDILLNKHSNHISKEEKPLIAEPYHCAKGEICDPVKNCQMGKNVKNIKEIEYSMKIDSGIIIAKSHCSVIGKCIGYNDFFHSSEFTAAEDRLIDIKENNAVFYHYFYSSKSKTYEPPFNITNFHTGSELYLNDIPHFSPDDKVIIEIRSIPKQESEGDFPTGFNINIYESNEFGEYKNIEPVEFDPQDPSKVLSTFLSRNPSCGETPHFHSWKNNREVRLSMLPPSKANEGEKVILSYDKKSKKWGCHEDLFPEIKCQSYLPSSTKFISNLATEQIESCY
jgi:hypothetical protein